MNKEAARVLGRWLFAAVAIYMILSPKPTGRFVTVSEGRGEVGVLDTATGQLWVTVQEKRLEEEKLEDVGVWKTSPIGTVPR